MQRQNPLQYISIIFFLILLYTFSPKCMANLFSESNITPNIRVVSRVNKKSTSIGEELRYDIYLYMDPATEIEIPTLKEIGNFLVKDSGMTRREDSIRDVVNVWYILAIYETGDQLIEGVDIKYKTREGIWRNIRSGKIKIYVQSVFERLKIEADIKPIEGPINLMFPYTWHIVMCFMAFPFGVYLIHAYIKKRRKVLADKRGYPGQRFLLYNQLCKDTQALKRNSDICGDDFIKYVDLTKRYLGSVVEAGNYEFTTEEFLNIVKVHKDVSSKYGEGLSFLLRVSDMAKFANYQPTPAQLRKAVSFVGNLIRDLTP